MSYLKKHCHGFTLIEILVSAMLLIVAVIAFFAIFISAAKLRIFSLNEFRMLANASSWLEKGRTGFTDATKYNNLTAQADIDLNSAASILQEDYTNWIVASEGNVDIVNPGDNSKGALYTVEENIDLNSGTSFKKITVSVLWDEGS